MVGREGKGMVQFLKLRVLDVAGGGVSPEA